VLCNAAEILRYTNAGWQQKDIERFSDMLMTVYYPLIRYYYPTANGNWDGAIIHSVLAIAVFTDNRAMFNNAVDHYLHAPVNGSLFKYVYPSGQCQESMRDQGHVQLGLGEFAGAAQIAYTQGVDLFSAGNNRLALGFEYTAGFLLGQTPQCYGPISERAKELRDDYECIYRHYTTKGINMPWSKKAADSVRPKASRSVLTAVRAPNQTVLKQFAAQAISSIGYVAGARSSGLAFFPADAIIVTPGQSVQDALNTAGGSGKTVVLKTGIHKFPETLKIPSGITLCGEGLGTVLFLDPASSGSRDAIVNATDDLHDITIRDLVIEGSNKTEIASDPNGGRSYRGGYNRGGITFRSQREGQMKNITLLNITLRNCTYNGVFISGADNVTVTSCDLNENGGSVVPGPRLQHNLLLAHCRKINVKDSRLDTSPNGSGIVLDHCSDATVTNCEIARNGYYGVLVMESKNITIKGNLVEANDRSGVMVEFLRNRSDNVIIQHNIVQYNNGYGVETYAARNSKVENNNYAGNGNVASQQKISEEKFIVLE
jgi:parallel beta-helix repeat protein